MLHSLLLYQWNKIIIFGVVHKNEAFEFFNLYIKSENAAYHMIFMYMCVYKFPLVSQKIL